MTHSHSFPATLLLLSFMLSLGAAPQESPGSGDIPDLLKRIISAKAKMERESLDYLAKVPDNVLPPSFGEAERAYVTKTQQDKIHALTLLLEKWPSIFQGNLDAGLSNPLFLQCVEEAQFYFCGRTSLPPTQPGRTMDSFPFPYSWEETAATEGAGRVFRSDWEFPELCKGGAALRLAGMNATLQMLRAQSDMAKPQLCIVLMKAEGYISGIGRVELDSFVGPREIAQTLEFGLALLSRWEDISSVNWKETSPVGLTAAQVHSRLARLISREMSDKMARHPDYFDGIMALIAEAWKRRLERYVRDGVDPETMRALEGNMRAVLERSGLLSGEKARARPPASGTVTDPNAKSLESAWRILCGDPVGFCIRDPGPTCAVSLEALDPKSGDAHDLFSSLATHAAKTGDPRLQKALLAILLVWEPPGAK